MSGVQVIGQLVEQVPLVGDPLRPLVPEVVVRVDNGKIGSRVSSWVKASQSLPPKGIVASLCVVSIAAGR